MRNRFHVEPDLEVSIGTRRPSAPSSEPLWSMFGAPCNRSPGSRIASMPWPFNSWKRGKLCRSSRAFLAFGPQSRNVQQMICWKTTRSMMSLIMFKKNLRSSQRKHSISSFPMTFFYAPKGTKQTKHPEISY